MKRGVEAGSEQGGKSKKDRSEQHRQEQFISSLIALNKQFATWAKEMIEKDPTVALINGGNDYIQYVSALEERFLRTYGEVFTFGSGECGQLAHGVESDADLSVRRPRIVKSLRDKQIRLVACGGIHSVAVGHDGRVWTWGCNDDGALGRPTGPIDAENPDAGSKGDENIPAIVSGVEEIVHVACGDSQTMALTVSGDVYGWGCYKDKEGRKWFDQVNNDVKGIKRQQDTPMKMTSLPPAFVTDVKCGASFNAALLKDGSVLTWGLGEVGDLGRPAPPLRDADGEYQFNDIANIHLKPHVPELKNGETLPYIKIIGTGMWHLFLVSANESEIYTSGLNNYGQLGLGDENNRNLLEKISNNVLDDMIITEIGGGQHHSMAISGPQKKILTWGRSDYGQLGNGGLKGDIKPGSFTNTPDVITLPVDATPVQMSCGENHNLVLTDKHQVFSWGFGEMGSLGHLVDDDELVPRMIDLKKAKMDHVTVMQVAGGGQHSVLVGRALN